MKQDGSESAERVLIDILVREKGYTAEFVGSKFVFPTIGIYKVGWC